MSKLNQTQLITCIQNTLKGALNEKGENRRKFPESIDLFVNLKNYDTQKDKRFSGSVKLPRVARPRFQVCVIGDAYHEEEATKAGVAHKNMEDLKKLNKNKKLVKKMCNEYDAFLASESVIRNIPRIVGPHMGRAGKFPTAVNQGENLAGKIEEIQSTVKFQLKKVLCLGACIGHAKMSEEDVRVNLVLSINFLVTLLKKNWQNIKSIYIKSTMGEPQRVY